MSNINNEESNNNSPVLAVFVDFIVYIVAATIVLIIGIAASLLLKDFTYLGRAGSLITLIAISMAYKDFYLDIKNLSFDETIKFVGKEKLFEIWASSFVHKKRKELEILKPGFNEEDALAVLENLQNYKGNNLDMLTKDEFIKCWLKGLLKIWSKKLREWEFMMLKIGTLLWAFADLINIPLNW